jgi:dihydroorotase
MLNPICISQVRKHQKSLAYIQRGKESGVGISCSVTPYHLYFTDDDMKGYNTNLKVNPPLRDRVKRSFEKCCA